MDNTIQALQNLYVALGGSLTDTYDEIASGAAVSDYVIIPDMINAIAQKAGTAGIELPAVSSDDDGKILMVVDGEWSPATLEAGS